MYWAYYLNYLFCAAKIASLRNKSIVRLAGAAKNLRLLLLNHHHFTQVIIFCVLQNSNGLFKGSLKNCALFLQQQHSRTDSLKRSCWGVKTHYFFSIFTRTFMTHGKCTQNWMSSIIWPFEVIQKWTSIKNWFTEPEQTNGNLRFVKRPVVNSTTFTIVDTNQI